MQRTITLKVEVQVEVGPGELEAAKSEVSYETEKALDYWYQTTDRSMIARNVTIEAVK